MMTIPRLAPGLQMRFITISPRSPSSINVVRDKPVSGQRAPGNGSLIHSASRNDGSTFDRTVIRWAASAFFFMTQKIESGALR